jgi:hypothetical protein
VKYSFSTIAPPCPLEDINLLSQTDVDDFVVNHPNCVDMVGSLTISGSSITNISALQNISSIAGGLQISNTSLVNLNGLNNLTSVGGGLSIQDNTSLVNISAIGNINLYGLNEDGLTITGNTNLATCNIGSICDYLSNSDTHHILNNKADCVNENAVIASCMPLDPQSCDEDVRLYTQLAVDNFVLDNPNCTHISGNLEISGHGIHSLTPLSNIISVDGDVMINNTNINSLNGLNALTTVGGTLSIGENNSLYDIDALSSINQVRILEIYSSLFSNINVFQSLTSVEGIGIFDNENLQNLDGLSGLTTIEYWAYISGNPIITNLDGLSNLEYVGDELGIYYHDSLENIDGLSNLEYVGGNLTISGNQVLQNIDGLINLTSIGYGLGFYRNELLENLNGLSGLENFEGFIEISGNPNLSDISGLENIDPNSIYSVYIVENPALSVCNLENLCTYFADFNNEIYVYDNAEGCGNIFEVYAACNIELPECPVQILEFYSQEDIDNFAIYYPSCTELPFTLYIYGGYDEITDISAFSNLTSIYGSIYIGDTNLENLDALSGLTSINGEIRIEYNYNLTSIEGLSGIDPESIFPEDIDYWYSGVRIVDNPELSLCNINSLCLYLSIPEYNRYIYDNGEGCEETDFYNNCELFCPFGDVEFNTQDDIYAFAEMYPNCTEIAGYLNIYSYYWYDDAINDISPLSNIQVIHGGLYIGNTDLTNLNALSNLTAVNGESIAIYGNEYLEDISGLSNVDLSNMIPIDMEYDGIYLEDNPLLSVCNLPVFCEYLSNDPATHPRYIVGNAEGCQDNETVLAACEEPFPCLAPVGINVLATFNTATINWSSLGTSFDIEWGFLDFELGEGIGMQYDIAELNFTITDLSPETEYDFYIRRNCLDTDSQSDWVKYTFTTISVCPTDNVYLYSQQDVDNFGAMYPDCTHISGHLVLDSWYAEDDSITDLSPLSNIESIGGELYIGGTQLTNLDDLSSLTSIDGSLIISDNFQLVDISGLQNISEGISGLYIVYNEMLSECSISSICTYLQYGGYS